MCMLQMFIEQNRNIRNERKPMCDIIRIQKMEINTYYKNIHKMTVTYFYNVKLENKQRLLYYLSFSSIEAILLNFIGKKAFPHCIRLLLLSPSFLMSSLAQSHAPPKTALAPL